MNSSPSSSPAVVAEGAHITLRYRVALPDGQVVLDTGDHAAATLILGQGMLAPALEQCLLGLQEGQKARFELAPDAAFGPRNPELIQKLSRNMLEAHGVPGEQYNPGDLVEFPRPDGGRYAGVFKGWGGDNGHGGASWALFDFNHPLAGQAVVFEVNIIGVL